MTVTKTAAQYTHLQNIQTSPDQEPRPRLQITEQEFFSSVQTLA